MDFPQVLIPVIVVAPLLVFIVFAMKRRPAWLLWFLIAANLAWAVVSTVLAVKFWSTAQVFGLLHIIGEGLFVTVLAWQEFRHRDAILQRQ